MKSADAAFARYPIGFTVRANPSMATLKFNEDGKFLTGTVETDRILTVPPRSLQRSWHSGVRHGRRRPTPTRPCRHWRDRRTTYVTGNAIRKAAPS
jgi:hypothetical protein